jgi:hypothetical protein
MGTSILRLIREVVYDPVDIVRRGHEQIHGLETWLRFSVARDRLDH